jgi:hypothetical protein
MGCCSQHPADDQCDVCTVKGINTITLEQITWATVAWAVFIAVVYTHSSWSAIRDCYGMWFTMKYCTDYNIVEAASWLTKAIIIVPGLIFGISVWWLFYLTLFTSLTLIWASNRKLLPTLVGFNTLWVWISCMVLAQHLV